MDNQSTCKIRMIALDLDETTLDEHSLLPERNRRILEHAAAAGIEIVIASGRSYVSMQSVIPYFPWSQYAICSNGAVICRTGDGSILSQHFLREKTVLEILDCCAGEPVTFEIYINGQAYADQAYLQHPENYLCDEATVRYVRRTRKPVPDIRRFIDEHIREIQSFVVCYQKLETKKRITEKLEALEQIYVTTSAQRFTEICDVACGKHMGLQFLAEMLQLSAEQVAAFGNADNDAEMLLWSGIGAAVENATDYCKKCANVITSDHRSCGVACVLEQLAKHQWEYHPELLPERKNSPEQKKISDRLFK